MLVSESKITVDLLFEKLVISLLFSKLVGSVCLRMYQVQFNKK